MPEQIPLFSSTWLKKSDTIWSRSHHFKTTLTQAMWLSQHAFSSLIVEFTILCVYYSHMNGSVLIFTNEWTISISSTTSVSSYLIDYSIKAVSILFTGLLLAFSGLLISQHECNTRKIGQSMASSSCHVNSHFSINWMMSFCVNDTNPTSRRPITGFAAEEGMR